MELSKNNRFRTGSMVDIYHTPVYETNTLDIIDISVGDDWKIEAKFEDDLSNEQFNVGDVCALSFGVGEITGVGTATQTGSNLLLHSEDISNAVWVKTNVNVSPDSRYSPDTMFTPADNLEATITSGEHKISQTVTKTAEVKTYTASVFLIENTTSTLQLKVSDANGSCSVKYDHEQNGFNIGQDVILGSWTLVDKGYDLMGGSPYKRFWMTFECSADTNLDFEAGLVWGFSTTDFTGVVIGIDVAGMQLEEYTQVGEYKITTDAIVEPISIGTALEISFPKSMFPDINVDKYVGSGIQHALFFLKTGRVVANFAVAKYKEEVKQAVYGYAKVIYNLQTEADLVLTPITMVDDGTLNAILYSKGFVLGACDTSNYTPSGGWNTEFPLELSGTSIDPIYRRAYLKKRAMTSSGRKAKAKLEFRLVG